MDHHDTIKWKITKIRSSVENLIKVEAGATFGVVRDSEKGYAAGLCSLWLGQQICASLDQQ